MGPLSAIKEETADGQCTLHTRPCWPPLYSQAEKSEIQIMLSGISAWALVCSSEKKAHR